MRQRQEFNSDTVQLATRVPKSLHVRVRVAALDAGITLAEWIGDALATHLAQSTRGRRTRSVTAVKRREEGTGDAA